MHTHLILAGVAQWQSSGFVNRRLEVQFLSPAPLFRFSDYPRQHSRQQIGTPTAVTNRGTDKKPVRAEDCEVVRTPEDLIAWIEPVEPQFHADDRIEEDLSKRFFEEIRPLGHLARHKYLGKPGLSLRPKIGDQNYDAEIIDTSTNNEHIRRVEFTSAYRDADLALREEYLDQHGDVYITGHVRRNGTKASGGQVQVIPEFEDHQIRLEKMLESVRACITNKLDKRYTANTILTIVFDDTILYETDLPQLRPRFRDIILSQRALGKFCDLYILGASGKTFLEFGETLPS